jgi:hypothetical protein
VVQKPLLKHLKRFRDRHGKLRTYVRLPGRKLIPLPGLPGSAEFMAAYQAALTNDPQQKPKPGRALPGTVAAAVTGYFGSVAFANLSDGTRQGRRQILERFREQHGAKRIATLQRRHVEQLVADKASKPGAALNFLIAIRALMRYAIVVGLRRDDPTIGITRPKSRSRGIYAWSEDECGW